MIDNQAILKNEFKKTSSDSAELNILRSIEIALMLIVIVWNNYGIFTYTSSYIPSYNLIQFVLDHRD